MKSVISTSVVFASILAASSAFAEDPGAPGPYAVSTVTYTHGDGNDYAFSCSAPDCVTAGSEMRAEVYYPTDLTAGPFPLLVFLHGRHYSCYRASDGMAGGGWPCDTANNFEPIPSYRGYDYLGKVLASHGYIVASISADGINGQDGGGPFTAIPDRARLMDAHLALWNTFNTAGVATDPYPFNGRLVGKVDLNRVGTMGHSRGGDAVVKHYSLFGGSTLYKVRAVLPIAPTNFLDTVIPNVHLGVVLSYCDGDVFTLEGSRFYDRARYADPADESSRYTFLSLGSNHNYFNTVWTPECWTSSGSCWSDARGSMPTPGTGDDYTDYGIYGGLDPNDAHCGPAVTGNSRLTPAQQRAVGLTYAAAFFRYHVGNESQFAPLLRGDSLPPAGIEPAHIGYHPPASERRDLNQLMSDGELIQTTLKGTGSLPGAVTQTSLELYDRCGFAHMHPYDSPPTYGDYCFSTQYSTPSGNSREVHLTNFMESDLGLSRLHLGWNAPGDTFVNELPAGARDVSKFETLQFRVGVDYEFPVLAPVAFSVVLEDGTSSATVSTNSQLGPNDLYFPPGDTTATTVMSTLRLPLALFSGVDLTDLRKVTLKFNGTPTAQIVLSDISFAGQAPAPACQASSTFVLQTNSRVTSNDGRPAVNTSGTVGTTIGSKAVSGAIRSVGPVNVLDQAAVQGTIVSAGAITAAASATTGAQYPNTSVSLPPLPSLPTFPASSGNIPPINPGTPYSLAAGSYGSVTVNSGGVLKLAAGDYYIQSLTVNRSARVEANAATRLFVRDALSYQSPFVDSSSNVVPIYLGFAGTNLNMEARFNGTLLAPNAQVSFGIGSGVTYTGSFRARGIEVRSGSALVCTPGAGSTPPTETCSDGTKNNGETGVDCGGPNCAPCGVGQPCSVPSDCATNLCVAGICTAPSSSLAATRTVTSDWGSGYCVTLRVTNNATAPTTNWNVSLNTNQSSIYSNWNGFFSGASGVISVAPAASWNRVIPPGGTDSTVGFCANRSVPGSGTLPIILSATGTY